MRAFLLALSLLCSTAFATRVNLVTSSGPPTQPSGYVAWYDGKDSLVASGGAISQWTDKGSNGINCTQSVGGSKPTLNTSDLNGNNTASFNGSTYLDCGSTALFDSTSAYTINIVGYQNGGNFPGLVVFKQLSANWVIYDNSGTATGAAWHVVNPGWGLTFAGGGPGNTVWFRFTATYNGSGGTTDANYKIYINGVSKAVTGATETPPTNRNAISNTAFGWVGKMAAITIWQRELNASELSAQATYDNYEWGL